MNANTAGNLFSTPLICARQSFCYKCIKKWATKKKTCPLCRQRNVKYSLNKKFISDMKEIQSQTANLSCLICRQYLRNPHLCNKGCGGEVAFCFPCITKEIEKSNKCPKCQSFLKFKDLIEDKKREEMLA